MGRKFALILLVSNSVASSVGVADEPPITDTLSWINANATGCKLSSSDDGRVGDPEIIVVGSTVQTKVPLLFDGEIRYVHNSLDANITNLAKLTIYQRPIDKDVGSNCWQFSLLTNMNSSNIVGPFGLDIDSKRMDSALRHLFESLGSKQVDLF